LNGSRCGRRRGTGRAPRGRAATVRQTVDTVADRRTRITDYCPAYRRIDRPSRFQ
jgi:hypothetical protein